jgi:hypothetical protein
MIESREIYRISKKKIGLARKLKPLLEDVMGRDFIGLVGELHWIAALLDSDQITKLQLNNFEVDIYEFRFFKEWLALYTILTNLEILQKMDNK